MLAEQFAVVMSSEPRAAKGSVEGLHDLRVALRRMRSLAMTFGPLDRKFLDRFDRLASRVCDRMGEARDIDVWIDLFRGLEAAGGLDEISVRERRAVMGELRAARKRLSVEALACAPYQKVKAILRGRLSKGPRIRRKPAPTVEALAARRMLAVRGLIEQRYRKVGSFSSKPAHSLRRSGRRMRYLSEFFAERLGPEAVRAGRWITKAQAALGKMHDCDSALELSRDLPTGKARAAVRRGLKKRRDEHLATFKAAWKHYSNIRLQKAWLARLEAAAER